MYELYYNDGGHGGPYKSEKEAIEAAKSRLRGRTTTIEVRPYTSGAKGGYAERNKGSIYVTKKGVKKSSLQPLRRRRDYGEEDEGESRKAASWNKRRHTWRLEANGAHILVTPRWDAESHGNVVGYDVSGYVRGYFVEGTAKGAPYSNLRQAKKAGESLLNKLASSRTAAKWETKPKGWTDESRKKFWNSLTGDVKHKVTKCMKQMEGKVDDPGAFCASLADRVEGKGWRSERASSIEQALGILKVAADLVAVGVEDLSPEVREEVEDDIIRALGGVPRKYKNHPKIKKLQKDIAKALNTL